MRIGIYAKTNKAEVKIDSIDLALANGQEIKAILQDAQISHCCHYYTASSPDVAFMGSDSKEPMDLGFSDLAKAQVKSIHFTDDPGDGFFLGVMWVEFENEQKPIWATDRIMTVREFREYLFTVGTDRALSFSDVSSLAKKYAQKGGNYFLRDWDRDEYDRYIEAFGSLTETKALTMIEDAYQAQIGRRWA